MELASGTQIADGLLAAITLLNEKPRLGFRASECTLHPGLKLANSLTTQWDNRSVAPELPWTHQMGRFMSPDPSGIAYSNPTNPQSFNLYSYALNNPLRFVDPAGLTACFYGGPGDSPQNDQDASDYEGVPDQATCTANGGVSLVDNQTVNVNAPQQGQDLGYDAQVAYDQQVLALQNPQPANIDPSLALATGVMSQGIPKLCGIGINASIRNHSANVSASGNGVGATAGGHSVGTSAPQNKGAGKIGTVLIGGPNGRIPFSAYGSGGSVTSVNADLKVKGVGVSPYVNLGTYTPNLSDPQNCPD